jgi:hypothetical protein
VARSRLSTRRNRSQTVRKFRVHKPKWIDPYPHIPGTEPEKRIFAELVNRRIFFIYQGQIPELQRGLYVTLAIPGYKPDFVIPEYKVIIDPFSPFHHSLPDAARRDREKIALYTAFGYVYYYPWALAPGVFLLDQRTLAPNPSNPLRPRVRAPLTVKGSAADVISAIPELRGPKTGKLTDKQKRLKQHPGYELGPFLGAGANSVAAANRSRRKPPKIGLSVGSRRGTRRSRPR